MNQVLVIGDIMLDRYYEGTVERISPEAPVPVISVAKKYNRLGGAANVANNLKELGNLVLLSGIIGCDECGESLIKILHQKQIDTTCIGKFKTCGTISKTRIVGNQQQIVRLDENDRLAVNDKEHHVWEEAVIGQIETADIVIISDYSKGTCDGAVIKQVIQKARSLNKVCIVDPKGSDWSKYEESTIITPNLKELSIYLGEHLKNENSVLEEKCFGICEKLKIDYLLITRSEKGMTLIDRNNHYKHYESKAREVYDVSGAGDTVVAALATFFYEEGIEKSVEIANMTAGIAVGKRGTATVSLSEIKEELEENKEYSIRKKIVSKEQLLLLVNEWKQTGNTVAFTNGCYDIFHKGHVYSIYAAAEFGDRLIVAINSDDSVKRLKGSERPINHEYDRAYVIAAMGCVDAVIIFGEDTPERLLEAVRPDVLVKGGDYRPDEIKGREYAGRVELVSYIDGYSTTKLIEECREEK